MKQIRNLIAFLFSLVSLFSSVRIFSKYLGNIDFMNELDSNQSLGTCDDQTKKMMKMKIINQTINRGRMLRKKSIISITWIFFAGVLAFFYGFFIKQISVDELLKTLINNKLQFISIFFFSFGTLGRIGWAGQSYSGNTVYERTDCAFLWISYFIGTFTGLLALM